MKDSLKAILLMLIVVCLGSVGCLSVPDVRQEIDTARQQACLQWQNRKTSSDRDIPYVTGQLLLEDALKLSLVNNKSLLVVMQETEVARGQVLASHHGMLPTLSLQGSYARYDEDADDKKAKGSLNEYSVGLSVIQPVFRGGMTQGEIRSALLLTCYSEERVREQTEATLYNVSSSYYQVLLARRLLKITQDAVTSAKSYLNEVSLKRDSGLSTEYNVLRARVDVALYEAEMIQQQNLLNLAKTQLLKEMGVSQESEIELSGDLVYRRVEPDFEKLVKLAYQNRPDLQQAQLSVYLSEEAIRMTISHYWPHIYAFASANHSRPDPYTNLTDEWGTEARVGVSGAWNLFDGFKREGQLVENRAMLQKRQLDLLNAEERVVLQVYQSILQLHSAEKFVQSQKLNLQHAREGLRLVEVGYRQGINTEIDVIDSRSALTRAIGLHYQAIFDHTIARLTIQKVTGQITLDSIVQADSQLKNYATIE